MSELTKLEWFAGMALQGLLKNAVGGINGYDKYLVKCAFDISEMMIVEAQQRTDK